MSHYAAGTRFEHRIRDDLRDNGYEVIRAAGSKGSSKIDLVALKPNQILFIQAKRSGTLPPAEWNRVHEVAGWVAAIPLLAANGPRGRGITYTRLLGPKVPRARLQPCEPFLLDHIAADHHLPLLDLTAAETTAVATNLAGWLDLGDDPLLRSALHKLAATQPA